uniref:Uncharacterized protein n=1 Tax=Arundo donax TaxID=35708 RepID=A0A0A9BHC5_ARUDO
MFLLCCIWASYLSARCESSLFSVIC